MSLHHDILLAALLAAGIVAVCRLALARRAAPRYFVRTWQPTAPEQWAAAFRQWPEDDPRWRATWDLLAFHLEAELGSAGRLGADPHGLAQWSGRVQMLLFIREQMLALRQQNPRD